MSIQEDVTFDKDGHIVSPDRFRGLFIAIIIILTAALGFGVGRLTAGQGRPPVEIRYDSNIISELATTTQSSPASTEGNPRGSESVYASAKGTKYYFMHCKSTVSEKNKVTFASAAMAEKAGYTLATNCSPR